MLMYHGFLKSTVRFLILVLSIVSLTFFSSSVFAQDVNPGQEGPGSGVPAPHLLEVLNKAGTFPTPAADASKFGGTVKIGGFSETYNGVLQMGFAALASSDNIQTVLGNNALVVNAPLYKPGYYFPGLAWSTGSNYPTKPKLGIWGQMNDIGSKLFLG
ncbi:MAG: hypothetical protein Q8P56_06060, partial [Candidatus Uhrbacteria bacterium]|nr:hypothetical protein [Candidatus Uhrbacteria bacterium]